MRSDGDDAGDDAGGGAAGAEIDAWLVGRARDGDRDAFAALLHRHRDRIFRIALRMLGHRADAEDITQDIVIQLWTGLAGFTGSAAFTTWLYRVVVNRCLNHRRSGSSAPVVTGAVPAEHERGHPVTPDAGRRATDRMRLAAAVSAVADLAPEQRSVFVLHQLEGLTYDEVARVLHLTEPAVRNRLSRARATLAHRLREWT